MDRADLVYLVALTLCAALLRFGSPVFLDFLSHPGSGAPITVWGIGHNYQDPKLPGLGQPGQIAPASPFVFDELYFANDALDNLRGRDYLDPEPPLAKLIIALGIKLFGFNSFGWRVMSALFGTAVVPLMYLLARQLVPIRFFAIAAGFLTTFDGLMFVESRTAVIDIFPIAFIVAAYLLFHLHVRAGTPFRQRWTIVVTALLLGLGLAAKWTALAAYGTVVVLLCGLLWRRVVRYDRRTGGVAILSLALLPAIVYLLSFTQYLTVHHSLDAFVEPPLGLSPLHFDLGNAWQSLVNFHRWTFNYHYTLRAPHPYYSPWFSWPALYRPVAYYYQSAGLGADHFTGQNLVAEIFNLGNPVIWWASIAALVTCGALAVWRRSYAAIFILVAFFAAWLPFSRVPRGLFLYHMLGGLPLMILALALVLTWVRPFRLTGSLARLSGPLARQAGRVIVYSYLATVLAFFIYFYPLWTGLPLPYSSWLSHMWVPSWI
ncbi:MAG TPA: phospholipid carrier-dependent glycosyltransferase [Candidatus Limnocylindrales bacterium]|nr:phospholipid carrier-dependent glycosyltransferase [Candidatus Limnocylindrales bacterium]